VHEARPKAPVRPEPREEDDLEEEISQLSLGGVPVLPREGLERLVALLEEVAREGLEGLLPVPGALRPEAVHETDQLGHGRARLFGARGGRGFLTHAIYLLVP
jgi:hypothetical protein